MISHYEPNLDLYERERIVLQCIRDNPHLHHNGLLKILVPEFMAKTTFEKVRDSLLEKEIMFVEKKGNMKFYVQSPDYKEKSQQRLEQNTNKTYHDLKLKIKRLDVDYPHKDIDEKILIATMLLENLLQTDNGFTVLDSIKNPKKTLYKDEHLTIQQLISDIFKIIKNDVDYEIIFPTIVSYLQKNFPKHVSGN
tara:strand:+ start:52 stop:633 length:582 start_codon:yes stop_codon:yes gene_type:complete